MRVVDKKMDIMRIFDDKSHPISEISSKIPALRGREVTNKKLVLEAISLNGPQSKWDVKNLIGKTSGTVSKVVDDLVRGGYLSVSGERDQAKRHDKSNLYGLTWKGFIASVAIDEVSKDLIKVLKQNPLLNFPLKNELLDVLLEQKIFSNQDLEVYAKGFFTGIVSALPYNIELIDDMGILAILPNALEKSNIDFSKIDTERTRSLIPVLRHPKILPKIEQSVENYRKQAEVMMELVNGLEEFIFLLKSGESVSA